MGNVRLCWPPIDGPPNGPALQGIGTFPDLDRLGLKLESKKASVEFLVVDRVEKVPTEN
jgi:uncharacterized protein (TIGR03435 family)